MNKNIRELKTYQHHIGFLIEDKLFIWGDGGDAQPEIIDIPKEIPVTLGIGANHSGVITKSGKLFMWGSNQVNQLGTYISGLSTEIPTEISIPELSNDDKPLSLVLGGSYKSGVSGMITEKGKLFMWGRNTNGQIGNGTVSNIIPTPLDITSFLNNECPEMLAIGSNHTGLITKSKKILMWGYNRFGQIANGSTEDILIPTEVKLPIGVIPNKLILGKGYKTSIITPDGDLYMWGSGINSFTDEISIPTKINIPNNEKVKDFASCDYNYLVLTKNNNLYIRGSNKYGQLGNGEVDNKYRFFEFTKIELPNNEIPKAISMGSGIDYFAHICVVTENNNLYVWGSDILECRENIPMGEKHSYFIKSILKPKWIKI